ncbi:MAG: tRNA uracil 4-sulfurtransferase ThiI [Parcubacteria group bacterium]
MKSIFNALIIHYDEIGLKGSNQNFFIGKLAENIRRVVSDKNKIQKRAAKFVVYLEKEYDEALLEKVLLIPGIANASPAKIVKSDLNEMKKAALEIFQFYKPAAFKIETVRAHKIFPLKSPEVSAEVGGYILESDKSAKVKMNHPDLTIKIEIEKGETAILGKKRQGVGGLPVGAAGKIVCLLSGGIDSPVAAFELMKRGATVVFVHFHNNTINKAGVESKIKRLVAQLSKIQGESVLYIVPFAELQANVIANVQADARMIVYRRLMFKIAERIAKKENALAIATGDSLSQVASQTLENLNVIYNATSMLKLAPLIGRNKFEIMDIAKKIGTYDISIEQYADCCSLLIAQHPETRATVAAIEKAESNLNVEKMIEEAVESARGIMITPHLPVRRSFSEGGECGNG